MEKLYKVGLAFPDFANFLEDVCENEALLEVF